MEQEVNLNCNFIPLGNGSTERMKQTRVHIVASGNRLERPFLISLPLGLDGEGMCVEA